jgi:hypothetical protein
MAVSRSRQVQTVGIPGPLQNQFPAPLIQRRAPTGADKAEVGQMWVDVVADVAYVLTSITAGAAVWSTSIYGGVTAPVFTITGGDLTVQNPGDIIVDTGNITATLGNIVAGGDITATNGNITNDLAVTNNATVGGNLDVTGDLTILGDFTLNTPNAIQIFSTFNGADAIHLRTNGGVAETMHLQVAQGTGLTSLNLESVAGGVSIVGGVADPDAIHLEASNAAGGIHLVAGTGGINLDVTNGDFVVVTGTGAINIGGDAVAKAITMGNVTGTTSIDLFTGTNGFSLTTGTGAVDISADAAATTINIGTGAAVVKTINLGDTGANVIAIGNTQTAGSVSIGAAMTTGTINIGGTGLQTGTVDIAVGTGAQAINLGTGAVGIKTIGIGTGAVANVITIGSNTGAAELHLLAGSAGSGIELESGGILTTQYVAGAPAAGVAIVVIDANVGKATFVGFTTAAAATEVFTITNAYMTATSGILVTAWNNGVADAQMTVTRVNPALGSFQVTVTNNGAAALDVASNIVLTFWIIE